MAFEARAPVVTVLVALVWLTPGGTLRAQYCGPSGTQACDAGAICEPVSSTLGVCCPDDPMTGMPPMCVGPDGPTQPTVLASDLLGLLASAQDPALMADLFTGPWTNWYYDGRERGLRRETMIHCHGGARQAVSFRANIGCAGFHPSSRGFADGEEGIVAVGGGDVHDQSSRAFVAICLAEFIAVALAS